MLATAGIEGVAAGRDQNGNDAIVIYLRDEAAAATVPPTLDGYPVRAEVTGPITAYCRGSAAALLAALAPDDVVQSPSSTAATSLAPCAAVTS